MLPVDHECFALTREVARSRSYGVFATARRSRVALYLGDLVELQMNDTEEPPLEMPSKENEEQAPRPTSTAEAGGEGPWAKKAHHGGRRWPTRVRQVYNDSQVAKETPK